MKCEIIRDLLPNYLDGLTSQASNEAIEEHLETCAECRRCLDSMREELVLSEEKIKVRKKELRPFRKAHRAVWRAAAVTALVCVLLWAGYTYYFERTWTVDSEDVKVTWEKSGGVVTLSFQPDREGIYINAVRTSHNPDVVEVKARHVNPLGDKHHRNGYCGYTFVDEDMILDEGTGAPLQLTGEEVLTVKFEDKTEKIPVAALYDGTGLNFSPK